MAYSLTARQVKDSSIRNIAGVCVDSPEFLQTLNEVTRRYMRRGGWWPLEVLMRVCVYGCDIVWPRQVGTVLGARFCRNDSVILKNNWWGVYGYRSCNWGWRGDAVMHDNGTRPCYNEITGNTGKYLTYRITKIQDVGKTIRFFGFQYGNQPLQELNAAGNWVPGLTLTATQTGVVSTVLVTKITSIIREPTQGRTFLYEVDPATNALHDLGMYEPDETNPAYRCSKIQNVCSIPFSTDVYGRHVRQAEVLVKLEFVPVVNDDDFVLIDNIEALKFGFQAFRLNEADDDEGARKKWLQGIEELNMELEDRQPGLQTTVVVNEISADCPILAPI